MIIKLKKEFKRIKNNVKKNISFASLNVFAISIAFSYLKEMNVINIETKEMIILLIPNEIGLNNLEISGVNKNPMISIKNEELIMETKFLIKLFFSIYNLHP
jgi:hypothetical protein